MFCTLDISMYFYRIKCRMKTTLIRVIILFAGLIIAHFEVSVVVKSDAGTGPNDLVGVVISDKLKKKFSIIRMIVDACFLVCGWLLGGVVGLGTVICLFLVGPVAGFFLPRSGKMIGKIIQTCSSSN